MNLVIRKVRNQDLYNVKDADKDEFVLKNAKKKVAEAYVKKHGSDKPSKASKKKVVSAPSSPTKTISMETDPNFYKYYKITFLPDMKCYQVKDIKTNRITAKCTTLKKAEKQIRLLNAKIEEKKEKQGFYASSDIKDYTFIPIAVQIMVENKNGDSMLEIVSLDDIVWDKSIKQAAALAKRKIRKSIQ